MRITPRRAYIDWARGIAVLLMIEAHTTDAWTRASAKVGSAAYRNVTILGGFAAPLFLWLAGLALVLSATRQAERTGDRLSAVEEICRRGLEIFVLAFLFRLQAFIVSPGAHPVTLFRVDILNVMGPAIVLAGLAWGVVGTTARRVLVFAALASALAMLTPVVRTALWVRALPVWLQWYLRPAAEHTTFTMFPWAGFVFAGGAVGVLLASVREERVERLLQLTLAMSGASLVAFGFYAASQPSIYRESSFWTSSPTWFAIRVGIMMVSLAVIYGAAAVAERADVALRPLERLGRSSLFVYWIHVELVYGYASWFWRGRLPLWGSLVAFAVFATLMYGAVLLRDRLVDTRRSRGPLQSATEPASA
jgi:uncharacterized membrane protein